jgi:hypothetical protein
MRVGHEPTIGEAGFARRERMSIIKAVVMMVIAMVANLYTAFVLQQLWNWFAVNALNAATLSYWTMYGLLMAVHLVTHKDSFEEELREKRMAIVLGACVPDAKRAEMNEGLKEENELLTTQLGSQIFGKAVGNTFALAFGWAVHTFLA